MSINYKNDLIKIINDSSCNHGKFHGVFDLVVVPEGAISVTIGGKIFPFAQLGRLVLITADLYVFLLCQEWYHEPGEDNYDEEFSSLIAFYLWEQRCSVWNL